MAKKKKKKPVGSPPSYKPTYCEEIIEFFAVARTERVVKSVTTGKNEYEKTEYETIANEIPFFSAFARKIGVTTTTLTTNWTRRYPEFLAAYNTAKELQKEFLIQNGLGGFYPPASYIFTAKNITDMRDEQILNTKHTGSVELKKKVETMTPAEVDIALQEKLLGQAKKGKK